MHIFLEALEGAAPGEVLVADNDGRLDESCVGDLVALEAQAAGLDGIVIWGLHRDTADIQAIGLPVFSLRAIPAGPPPFFRSKTSRWSQNGSKESKSRFEAAISGLGSAWSS